jgi:hypothetical protein
MLGMGLILTNARVSRNQLDPDAKIYLDYLATQGTVTPTMVTAVNGWFLIMKTPIVGVTTWSLTDAVKLCVGGTAAMHQVDAKTPATQDARFFGSPTHGFRGVVYNGSTQYSTNGYDNNAIDSINFTKLAFVSADNGVSSSSNLFGCMMASGFSSLIGIERNNATNNRFAYGFNNANTSVNIASGFSGLVGVGRDSTTHLTRYYSGVATKYVEARQSTAVRSVETTYAALGLFGGSIAQYFNGRQSSTWEGKYLNQAHYDNLNAAFVFLNTTLGR